jgi:hypothetical protein
LVLRKVLEKTRKFKNSGKFNQRLCKTTLSKIIDVWIDQIRKWDLKIGKKKGQTKEITKTEIFTPRWSGQFLLWNNYPADR